MSVLARYGERKIAFKNTILRVDRSSLSQRLTLMSIKPFCFNILCRD